jgi:arylsulfatase A-like enzyme
LGALTGGLIFTLILPPLAELFLAEQVVLAQFGAVLLSLPVAALYVFGFAARRQPEADPQQLGARAITIGLGVASVPLWSSLIALIFGGASRINLIAVVLAVLLIALSGRLARVLAARPVFTRGLLGLGLIGALLAIWMGPIERWATRYDFEPMPSSLAAIAETAEGATTPDVILISVDTLRADAVYGPDAVEAPTFASLRERGMWAPYARSSSNCTIPGHAGMLTGLGALEHRVIVNYQDFPPEPITISEVFRDNGWATTAVVSNGLMLNGLGFERGFLHFDDSLIAGKSEVSMMRKSSEGSTLAGRVLPRPLYRRLVDGVLFARTVGKVELKPEHAEGGRTTARAMEWFDVLYAQDDPFFFFLHYIDPHAPYRAPIGFMETRAQPSDPVKSSGRYLEEVDFIDRCIEQVVERMDQSGRPYIICITSDHGEHLGEHDLFGHTNSGYEELIRVPFVVAGPGIPQRELHSPHVADVAPTLIAAAGLAVPEAMKGLDLLHNEAPTNRLHFMRENQALAIQQGDWSWVAWYPTVGLPKSADELSGQGFNLAQDPAQLAPLSDSADFTVWLESVLEVYAAAPPPIESRISDLKGRADKMAMLIEMGYMDQDGNQIVH